MVGAGALGGPAAMYLAAAGVGALTLIDDDTVSLSNLQRQVLFATPDVGRAKTEVARERLSALNPDVKVMTEQVRLTAENAGALVSGADIVIDGSDSFATRFDVNDACHRLGRAAGLGRRRSLERAGFGLQVGLTKGKPPAERLPCYRCLVAEMPETEETCAMVGVIGPLTGMIGARMALEAVKEITGAAPSMAGKLWLFDGLSGDSRTVKLVADPACVVCGS